MTAGESVGMVRFLMLDSHSDREKIIESADVLASRPKTPSSASAAK
ncbi:MAG: hypothetical protein R2747_11610 [Pyrinomonadaceae bacterium]